MKFGGFKKTSLIDFPDRISSVLFTVGCNLRCPFCYNWPLITNPKPPFLSEEAAERILQSRKRYVTAVVITGGEPTMNQELPTFIGRLKQKGFSVKLDTNGFFPETFERCLPNLDYVAMDIKTSIEKYGLMGSESTDNLLKSIMLLKQGKVDYEFRTTVVPGIVEREDILKIGELLEGSRRFVLQQFIPGQTLDEKYSSLSPFPSSVLESYADIMKKYTERVEVKD